MKLFHFVATNLIANAVFYIWLGLTAFLGAYHITRWFGGSAKETRSRQETVLIALATTVWCVLLFYGVFFT